MLTGSTRICRASVRTTRVCTAIYRSKKTLAIRNSVCRPVIRDFASEAVASTQNILDEYYSVLEQPGLEKDYSNKYVSSMKKIQNYDIALTEIQRLKRITTPDKNAYGLVISLATHSDGESCMSLYTDMVKAGHVPSRQIFAMLLSFCIKDNDINRSLQILEDMHKLGVKPHLLVVKACKTLFDMALKHNSINEIESLLSITRKLKLSAASTEVYNLLIGTYVRGDLELAMKLFTQMKQEKIKPDEKTYSLLLNSVVSHPRFLRGSYYQELSNEITADMKAQGIKPGAAIFCTLAEFYGLKGNLSMAFKLVEHMKNMSIPLQHDFFVKLFRVCTKSRKWIQACKAYELMVEEGLRPNLMLRKDIIKMVAKVNVDRETLAHIQHVKGSPDMVLTQEQTEELNDVIYAVKSHLQSKR